uniref:NADH-ubiquinone oxidoreductase chain 3 n=1 Tax=Ophiomusa kimblae TaxID=3135533 RepID=A0AAU6PX64_9ECHI
MPALLILILITFSLSLILFFLGHLLPQNNPYSQKNSPYECGFDPINPARLPFSFRFFLVALLFILFDLEIALLLPLPFTLLLSGSPLLFLPFLLFILLLSLGLLYEWQKGGLEWAS